MCILGDTTWMLLILSGLPHNLWANVMAHACWILNQMPTWALDGKTPYKKVTGRKLNLAGIQCFNATAYLKLENAEKLNKWALKSHFSAIQKATTASLTAEGWVALTKCFHYPHYQPIGCAAKSWLSATQQVLWPPTVLIRGSVAMVQSMCHISFSCCFWFCRHIMCLDPKITAGSFRGFQKPFIHKNLKCSTFEANQNLGNNLSVPWFRTVTGTAVMLEQPEISKRTKKGQRAQGESCREAHKDERLMLCTVSEAYIHNHVPPFLKVMPSLCYGPTSWSWDPWTRTQVLGQSNEVLVLLP